MMIIEHTLVCFSKQMTEDGIVDDTSHSKANRERCPNTNPTEIKCTDCESFKLK